MGYVKTFTERHAKPKDRYSYELSDLTRHKMLQILKQHDPGMGRQYDFGYMLEEVKNELLKRFGRLYQRRGSQGNVPPVIEHIAECSTEEALDSFELCFQTNTLSFHGEPNQVVEEFNRVLEADAVGYELTEFKPVYHTGPVTPAMIFASPRGGKPKHQYPKFIKKGEQTTHEQAVKPALMVLSDPRFATANKELLKAFEEVRKGDYADALTDCGSAFESVLKTICQEKGWAIDPNKDACAALVEACRKNNLFEPFYVPMFTGVGTTRSKMGDAHGKAGTPEYSATSEHAEHLIAVVCSHITFLVKQAGI